MITMFVNFGVSPLACLSSAVRCPLSTIHSPLSSVRRLLCLPAILFSPCGQFVRETVRTLRLDSAQNEAKLALALLCCPAASVAAVAQLHSRGERGQRSMAYADVWGHHLGPHAW